MKRAERAALQTPWTPPKRLTLDEIEGRVTPALVQEALRNEIEALSAQQPMYSRSAYTHRRTRHVAFGNGAIVSEMGAWPIQGDRTLIELARDTLKAVKAYRDTIDGPVLLTWRIEPEITHYDRAEDVRLYVRLCFEPDLWADDP